MSISAPRFHLQILMQIGYVAAGAGRLEEARRIFGGLAAARPENASPWIGLGVAELNANRPDAALQAFEQAVSVEPEADLARAFAAMAMHKLGRRHECEEALRGVAATSRNSTAVRLAENLLAHPID